MDNSAEHQASLEAAMAQLRARRDQRDRERRARRERQRIVNLPPLDVTHTFKDRQREIQALQEYLADGRVRLVTVVGRGGIGKTALVCHVLAELEDQVRPAAPEDSAPFPETLSRYEAGLDQLRRQLPAGHPRYAEALVYEQRLRETIAQARLYGDTAAHQAERAEVIARLNDLTQAALGLPFNDLRGAASSPAAASPGGLDGLLYLSARSTGLSLERIYTDVGRMLGEPAAGRLANFWASDSSLSAKVERLLESMQGGNFGILLDNLEDCLTAQGEIAEEGIRLFLEACIRQASGAWLVATSREEVKTPRAALANTRRLALHGGLPEEEAIALLRELDPQGELGLCDAPETDLRRAAQLTRGIPRALEIIVGILQEDPAANLHSLLSDEALFGEQVVERLVEEGYARLGHNERRIMEALAVFDRPAEATAVAFLLYPWFPELDVRAGLRRLAGCYFASVSRATGEYSLHPLDREHAYCQLPGGDGEGVYTQRNMELRAAELYAAIRKPASEWKTVADLFPQLAEFEHRVRAGDIDNACRVADSIDRHHLYVWGYYTLLYKLRSQLLGRIRDTGLEASNLGHLGNACRALGHIDQAINLYNKALSIVRERGDRQEEGNWLGELGRAYYFISEFERAREYYQEALTIAQETGNKERESIQLAQVGVACRVLGYIDQAIRLYERGLAICQELHLLRQQGVILGSLGTAHRDVGKLEEAIDFYEKSLTIMGKIGDRRRECFCVGLLGIVHRSMGRYEQALGLHERAAALACDVSDRRSETIWHSNLGIDYYYMGGYDQAARYHSQTLTACREIGDKRSESFQLLWLGKILLLRGEYVEAQRLLNTALGLNIAETSYQAALALGTTFLYHHTEQAQAIFINTATLCQILLDRTADLYAPRFFLAGAYVGQVISNPHWSEVPFRPELLAAALSEYRRALAICSAPGVIQETIRNLELIQAAGIEGLEPVFELLRGARYEPDATED